LDLYRNSVERAIGGARGQAFLRKLRDSLEALPVKRLITDALEHNGEVCALGAVDPKANVDPDDPTEVGRHFGIARSMAAEIVYVNDEHWTAETPEQRWGRMRAWVERHIDARFD
jgi:hypothetical protein